MKFSIRIVAVYLVFGLLMGLFSCKKQESNFIFMIPSEQGTEMDSSLDYQEPFRPQFHFSPKKNWMNDPNGLVYYKGIYHLFYQYYPKNIVWGPMHWGHATSTDLIHWTNKKIALFPDKFGLIFSGSAVVDTQNTSGLGTLANPPMIAIFTYHNMEGEKAKTLNFQTQGLAFSLDQGETWTKYSGNPIIKNPGLKDFRDPKVFWNPETKQWDLVLVAGDRAQFYSSKNLLNWTLKSEFGKGFGAHGGVWECPDLYKIKVENTNEEKWVLSVSINPGAPNGGSATQYFIGDYDGKTFKTNQKEIKWMDYGTDNYAGVTYNNAPKKERIFVGWMSNWQYAMKTPTKNWRSALTLPRIISLVKINSEYLLKNTPVKQLESISKTVFSKASLALKAKQKLTFHYENLNQSDLQFEANRKDLKLVFSNDLKDSLVLNYNAKQKTFSIDRRKAGIGNFEPNFAAKIHSNLVPNLISETLQYRVILDRSSIEIFLNEGLYSFTEQIFPRQAYTYLKIQSAENQEIKNLTIRKINGIWHKQNPK